MKAPQPPAESPRNPAHPARKDTDSSLRSERKNTDDALAERLLTVEAKADELVEQARDQADAVLEAARGRADGDVQAGSVAEAEPVEAVRALEDATLARERAAADETLRRERAKLAAHLPIERELTDRYLLTERMRADDALARRDDFMGMVSHDLRGILTAMGLTATQLAARASQSAEGHRTIEAMKRFHRYVARMDRLIEDLVDVVSIDAGTLAMWPQRRPVTTLIADAVEPFAFMALEKGIALTTAPVSGELEAQLDADRILQVLANLIGNALKFTERGGTVEVAARHVDGATRFTVADTGIGIPEDKLEAVFRRFWQVEHDQRGLGLGLYISKCIIEAHGGVLGVTSAVGKGSVFHFTIPDRPAQVAHEEAPAHG